MINTYDNRVPGPIFPATEFTRLSDAIEYASAMSHDMSCAHQLTLFQVEQWGDDEDQSVYWIACGNCGDCVGVSPVVYYRYTSQWEADAPC